MVDEKVKVIYNCVDLDYFIPSVEEHLENNVKILIIAKYSIQKNILGFIDVINLIKMKKPYLQIQIDWYGDKVNQKIKFENIYDIAKRRIKKYKLNSYIKLNEPVSSVVKLYQNSSVFILPSFYEGIPNVVCEAMACGKPILISDVCDNRVFVKDGVNGFLFNPHSVKDMAEKIIKFTKLSDSEKKYGNK